MMMLMTCAVVLAGMMMTVGMEALDLLAFPASFDQVLQLFARGDAGHPETIVDNEGGNGLESMLGHQILALEGVYQFKGHTLAVCQDLVGNSLG